MAKTAPDLDATKVDGRASRWDDHKADRREQILRAAVAAVGAHGPEVGVQEIAERAGVPRSVVYRLFKDRADLDEHLRLRILDDLMAHLAPTLTPEGTVRDAIARAVDTYIGWIVANPQLHHFLGMGSASSPARGARSVTDTKTAIGVQIAEMLDSVFGKLGLQTEAAESLAFALVGMVDSSINRWLSRSRRPLSAAELSAYIQQWTWQVLAATAESGGIILVPETQVSDLL
ncbi:TetR/AcrR family transcriptional regulator [Nocardia stercoris]|uniref:TetR/AcrR family transcriptional regulator n=1 Tax=Nocardia stercoris TaxID=2483361 RepID=A0A3M2L8T9_9NOCA|nr:TetR/AcrR family transcriptional regulator [Nocardia stercoris]RMI33466.1 TetR/AcrR family transcriptional regulator [Nocardia stercoris]